METFESGTAVGMEMGLPMEMVAEEVVSQDEGGADSDCQTAAVDSLTSQPSVNILNKFGKELVFPGDSSEDEDNSDPSPAVSRIYALGPNAAEKRSGDMWTSRRKDDCLCWECGERFNNIERLMVHFRKHEAFVRCHMCRVTFRRVVSLSMHLDNVHNNISLYCTACCRTFHSKWDLNEHLGKHLDLRRPPIMFGPTPPCPDALVETEVCLVTSDMEAPVPQPVSLHVSVPVSRDIPVSAPTLLAAPTPAPVSVPKCLPVSRPVPASVPVPVSVPEYVPASAPITVFVPKSVPASAPAPGPVPEYPSTSLPVTRALPVSAPNSGPVPLAAPVSVPIYLPLAIPLSLPMAVPIPTSVPGPVSEPVPMSVPVSMASSTPSPPSAVEDHGSALDESILPELVARDHTYNIYQVDNGAAGGTYSLRPTKRLPKSHPKHSPPKGVQENKRHLSVLHNTERVARVAGDKMHRHMKEVAEERDVKPDASSLIPPLPRASVSSEQAAEIKHEGLDTCSDVVPWDGEPIEEDEDLDHSGEEEEQRSDGAMSLEDGSEYSPGSASDASTESISSGNSSGSSYTPKKRGGMRKAMKTRRRLRVKKLIKATLRQKAIAPPRKPVATDSVKIPQSIRGLPNPQPSIQAAGKDNVVEVFAPGGNKAFGHPSLRPSRMYACDQCREVFPEQVTYRRHHCPAKTASIMSWSTTSSTPAPSTTAAPIQKPATAPIPAPRAATTIKTPSTSGLASTTGKMLNSSSGVMKVTQMAVPGNIQNSTLVSSLPVASGPVFTLPSIMLPSPSPSVKSGSQPVMATVVFNGSAGKLTRLVLQSQGLTFPTHTLSQSQPISLSVPVQANASTAGQASPSVQLANLVLGGLIQSQTLGKSPHLTLPSAPSTVPLPGHAPTPASASKPDPVLIPAPIRLTGPTSAPVTGLTPTSGADPVPVSAPSLTPATAPKTIPVPKTVPTPISAPAPKTVTTLITAPAPKTVPTPNTAPLQISVLTPLNASVPSTDSEPLRILGMFANRSQEFSLEKRLEKNWRSKGVFLCRQCGAISRQPSLGVRHRYLHQGSRRHRCHCGRTFLHRLHLLRHHVQHAEATRFVCAPCGQTFSGARCLARHKQDQEGKRKKRVRSRKDCHTPFSCDCGQIFQRPTAFLWHKLKNPKQKGVTLRKTEDTCPSDVTASQIETCPL